MALSALTGSVFYILLLLGIGYVYSAVVMAVFVIPFMLYLAFGWDGWRNFIFRIGLSLLSAVLLDGIISALSNLFGIKSLYLYGAALAFPVAKITVSMLAVSVHQQNCRMRVTFVNCGKSASCMGLYDSGNLLRMPDSGEPVHIASPKLLGQLLAGEPVCEIPYQTLGTDGGIIAVYRLESMCIEGKKGKNVYGAQWVGMAQEGLLHNKPYQVILNSAVHLP